MKSLYKFKINKLIEKDIPTPEKDKDGKAITVIRKQTVNEPHTFIIKKPNRSDQDEAGLFHDIQFGKDVRAGVLTHSEVIKRFVSEDAVVGQVYKDYAAKENEYQRMVLEEKSPENTLKKDKLEQELLALLRQMENFEISKEVFNSTAEARARNRTLLWWILNLAYTSEEKLFFFGETFEQKLEQYDKIIESENLEDKFNQEVVGRFLYFILFWYKRLLANRITIEIDFEAANDALNEQIDKDKEEQDSIKKELDKISSAPTQNVISEVKSEVKPEAKEEVKEEVKEEAKAEVKTEVQAEVKKT